jgi:hypothetical protein
MPDTGVRVGMKKMGVGHLSYDIHSDLRKAWGFAEILLPRGRMGCLTIRVCALEAMPSLGECVSLCAQNFKLPKSQF